MPSTARTAGTPQGFAVHTLDHGSGSLRLDLKGSW